MFRPEKIGFRKTENKTIFTVYLLFHPAWVLCFQKRTGSDKLNGVNPANA
jgi:hypothetical protein